ncbi:MAG: hypothetical protein ACFFDN_04920, partial [Candidatus Hodarchaeota archaeon]
MIQRTKIELSEERRILSLMITSTPFLTNLRNIAEPRLFKSLYSRIIADWVWEFFEHTKESPGKAIEEIYVKNKHTIRGEEENDLIAEFLKRLSSDWDELDIKNIKYTVKNAVEYFKLRSIEEFKESLELAITNKDIEHGESLIANYRKIDKQEGE